MPQPDRLGQRRDAGPENCQVGLHFAIVQTSYAVHTAPVFGLRCRTRDDDAAGPLPGVP